MPLNLFEIYGLLPAFLLVLFRVSGIVLATPLFSAAVLPARVKVLLSAAIALAVFPLVRSSVTVQLTVSSALAGMVGELMIGLFVGLSVTLMMLGVQVAAQVVSYQAGIALGQAFNPMLDDESTVIAQLYFLVAMMVFLAVGGHRAVVVAVLDSFQSVPPLQFQVTEDLVAFLVDLLTACCTMAIRVAAPVILALMLAFMTLGFISKTVPQLNILTVGFPIKIAMALLLMALTMMSLEDVLLETLTLGIDGIRAGLGLPILG